MFHRASIVLGLCSTGSALLADVPPAPDASGPDRAQQTSRHGQRRCSYAAVSWSCRHPAGRRQPGHRDLRGRGDDRPGTDRHRAVVRRRSDRPRRRGAGHRPGARAEGPGARSRGGLRPADGAPATTYSWRQRRVVTTDSTDTIADGVAGRRPSGPYLTISSWSPTTRSWSGRRRSSPACGCSSTRPAWPSSHRRRSASQRYSRIATVRRPPRGHDRVRQQRRRGRLPPLDRHGSGAPVLTIGLRAGREISVAGYTPPLRKSLPFSTS
jgi:hypothetical protein